MDIQSIITDAKKEFTRDRASVINDFLEAHTDAVILSYIRKARGDSIKFYYLRDGKKCTSDYVVKNAMRGVDITEPELPTRITSETEDRLPLPDEFWDAIYEYLRDTYGEKAGKIPSQYGVEVIIDGIEWEDEV